MNKRMKLNVTPELARLIKTTRVKNGVSAKELAASIGKSRSYVSKLESGSIKTIERELLAQVLCLASGSDDFYGKVLPDAVQLLRSTMGEACIADQAWLIRFDVVERVVEVPPAMAQDFARNLDAMGVSKAELLAFANANIDSQESNALPANEIILFEQNGTKRLIARMDLTEEDVNQVLCKSGATTTYFKVYALAHAMFRLQLYPDYTEKLPPEEATSLLRCVAAFMDRWDFHSLIGFSHMLSTDEFRESHTPLTESESDTVNRVACDLRKVVALDSLNAIGQLSVFEETLEWDPAFALKLMGIPFARLGDMSFANKRELLEQIQGVFERYASMDDFKRKMENY
ncbi:MAG: multiprotein-bridging factor 1 family protein [Eggerthellaceae bacterium]